MVRTYKLYASITASATAAAQVDIRRNGRILGIQICIGMLAAATAGDICEIEISLYPSSQITTNDAMGVLAYNFAAFGVLTSGAIGGSNIYKPVFGQNVAVGDRIYMHAGEVGSQTYPVVVLVDVEEM